MAYDPRNDPAYPDCTDETPKIYDVLDNPMVRVSVWAGEGQLASVKINGKKPTEDKGMWTLELGAGTTVKNTTIAVDAAIAHVNPLSQQGSLTIAAYQIHDDDTAINKKKWCETWTFTGDDKVLSISIYAQ
jgi:hypothetical protein